MEAVDDQGGRWPYTGFLDDRDSERRTSVLSTKAGVTSWKRRVSVCSAMQRFIEGKRMNAYLVRPDRLPWSTATLFAGESYTDDIGASGSVCRVGCYI
jgi:hypothetical protein